MPHIPPDLIAFGQNPRNTEIYQKDNAEGTVLFRCWHHPADKPRVAELHKLILSHFENFVRALRVLKWESPGPSLKHQWVVELLEAQRVRRGDREFLELDFHTMATRFVPKVGNRRFVLDARTGVVEKV